MTNKKSDGDLYPAKIGTLVLVFVGMFFLIISSTLTYFAFFTDPGTQENFSGRGAGGALAMGAICIYFALKRKKQK